MTTNTIGNNYLKIEPTGEITYPLQSAFYAYLAADKNNVTGDGTIYTIPFDTELFDRNSDFNTGTGVFVAPVTGIYHLSASVLLLGGGAKTGSYTVIYNNTQSTNLVSYLQSLADASALDNSSSCDALCLLTAGDNISVYTRCFGGGLTADVSAAQPWTFFCGALVC